MQDEEFIKPTFEEFYEESKSRLFPYIRKKLNNNSDSAKDVFQDAMISVLENYHKIDNPWKYAWRIIENKLFDYYKSNPNHISLYVDKSFLLEVDERLLLPEIERLNLSSIDSTEFQHAVHEANEIIAKALAGVDEKKRAIFLDYQYNGWKQDEKTFKIVKMGYSEFIEKHGVTKTVFYDILAEIETKIRSLLNE